MQGRDKLCEDVDGMPLLRLQVDRACATGGDVYVTVPSADHPRAVMLSGTRALIVPVPDASVGLSASLRAGLAAIPPTGRVMFSLADLIDLTSADLTTVLRAPEQSPRSLIWRGATADGKPGHPVLIADTLRAEFESLSGDTGGGAILRRYAAHTTLVPLPDQHARYDLDTPADWAAWRAARSK